MAYLTIIGPNSHAFAPIVERPGDIVALEAIETLTDGRNVDATHIVTWASSSAAIATVSATGSVQAIAVGTTIITATLPAAVPTMNLFAPASVTLDVIGSDGLAPGAPCGSDTERCSTGLSCCASGRLGPLYCTAQLSCPMYP